MEQVKFIAMVKQFPQVWDRNCATFRDQDLKSSAWSHIGEIVGCTAATAKDTFKSLREKYVREREKQAMFGDKYRPWQHLGSLSFLDPHIILRKQSLTESANSPEDPKINLVSSEESLLPPAAENYSDFDKTLIALVRKAGPIWDRKSNGYPSKQVKFQLWRSIAHGMKKDVNVCMMRWKGLREKYIRQKNRYQEGDGKWEFLDDMVFLDKVIQYRRKNSDSNIMLNTATNMVLEPSFHFPQNANQAFDDSLVHDSSSNEFVLSVKSEDLGCDMQDGLYDSDNDTSRRKRRASDNCESYLKKREKNEDVSQKSPERMFGELVAAMLARKTERDKNNAMMEIMKVLTK